MATGKEKPKQQQPPVKAPSRAQQGKNLVALMSLASKKPKGK